MLLPLPTPTGDLGSKLRQWVPELGDHIAADPDEPRGLYGMPMRAG